MPFHAKPGCPRHLVDVYERAVNDLPSSYLLPPVTGEAEKKAREQQWQIPKEGESQGGTSITLAICSPERPSRVTLPSFLPASTAPPRLQREESAEEEEQEEEHLEEHLEEEEHGRGKRRRVGTCQKFRPTISMWPDCSRMMNLFYLAIWKERILIEMVDT